MSPSLYNGLVDSRLQLMDRVVAVIVGDKSLAVPFSVLRKEPAVHYRLNGQDLVVFYQEGTASSIDSSSISQGRDVGATGVFDPHLDGEKLTFQMKDDQFVDDQTGSTWNLFGRATSGGPRRAG